ncbi:MAG: hypothetical protein ABIO83_07640, partial [Ilumatobacteraceae bacterium]
HYDPDISRYFLAVLTIDQDSVTGAFTGKNRIDFAVSATSDPTGSWFRYKLAVQNDGTEGTPNHRCDGDPSLPPEVTNKSACIGDYPHIGVDKYGFFLTTNEYSFFSDGSNGGAGYTGAQIYAMSKRSLAAGSTGSLVLFANPALGQFRSFTVWPAIAPAGQDSLANGGTEYLMSSTLGDGSETGNTAASEDRLGVWAITNTSSLDSATPRLQLASTLVHASTYALPPQATQKDGPAPLRDCLNDREDTFGPGLGCWALFFDSPPDLQVLGKLDAGDTRMQQVAYSKGMLWGALSTAVSVRGDRGATEIRAGVLWVGVKVKAESDGRTSKVQGATTRTGYLALAGNDVSYPALGLSTSGKLVVGVTVSGADHYPSAGYALLDARNQRGNAVLHVASEGVGPQDGFTEYPPIGGDRPRWGDYGALAMDGDTVWVANESIEQSCTLDEWLTGALGSCGGTRTALANWGTRITALRP